MSRTRTRHTEGKEVVNEPVQQPQPARTRSRGAVVKNAGDGLPDAPNVANGLQTLKPNPKNPRKDWRDEQQKKTFNKSLMEFGDLSGIVLNTNGRKTQLVGGHKRVAEFKGDAGAKVIIETKLDKPDATGGTAYGHVILSNGVRFAYREVKWDKSKEAAANLAANKWGAEWDLPEVKEMLAEAEGFDLALTGFELAEINELIGDIDSYDGEEPELPTKGYTNANGQSSEAVYSGKIDPPIYEMKGIKPSIDELVNQTKTMALIKEIKDSNLEDKQLEAFLINAAKRHNRFDYGKIAEFYAHATKEVQALMEKSALVIIDFESAIENGYVKLTDRMKEAYIKETSDTDER